MSPVEDPTSGRPGEQLLDLEEPIRSACGMRWTQSDVDRFLRKCIWLERHQCLIWIAARSRGRGNTAWYGSFWLPKRILPDGRVWPGRTVRAHKFYAVAVLGLRPEPGRHLDHTCQDSLCVRHIECVPELVNLARRWAGYQLDFWDGNPPPVPRWQDKTKTAALDPPPF